MPAAAVLPVKRFDRAKQRLAHAQRAGLAETMVADVVRALAGARSLAAVLVVTADEQAAALAAAHRMQVVAEPGLLGHNGAAGLGVERAVALGADRVLLVPGDCPLLRAEDVDGLLERHADPGVVVVPDRHGTGTNALLLAPPRVIAPSFGPGSRERHERLAAEAGVSCVVDELPALMLDVDTLEDLTALERARARAT